ncbi:transposase [Streptomyces brasiliscabiei]|uniref:transposase n=1 Tax=Streptomyces brasiliscabiei TaxID=2736302 RepID=UPI001C10166F
MGMVEQLAPDGLWEIFQGVAPEPPARAQGGGQRLCDDRAVRAANIFVATSGCTWRHRVMLARLGAARREQRVGLVPVRDRLGQCPGGQRGPLARRDDAAA